ncbi:MAG: STAS domain-containing protein [Gallionella sp.]
MNIHTHIQENVACITMSSRFDSNLHLEFKRAYTPLISNALIQDIEIELSRVKYLDSSALSMLFLLNERANDKNKSITLKNPSSAAVHILRVSNFNHLFKIKHDDLAHG